MHATDGQTDGLGATLYAASIGGRIITEAWHSSADERGQCLVTTTVMNLSSCDLYGSSLHCVKVYGSVYCTYSPAIACL